MISGFDIVKHLPEDSRYFRFNLKPMSVELMSKDMYGCVDYNSVTLHSLLVTFSFKTYRKFYIGPQVCVPTYDIQVIYEMKYENSIVSSQVSGMELSKFINSLKEKETFDAELKEAFLKAQDVLFINKVKENM